MQLMRMNYVPKHSRDHVDSEYVSYVAVDRKGAEFIGNKQRNYKRTETQISRCGPTLYRFRDNLWHLSTPKCTFSYPPPTERVIFGIL